MIHSWFPFNIVFFFRPPKSMKLDVIIARRIEVKNGVCGGQPSISWSRELQYISSNSMGSKTSLMMSFKHLNHVGVWRCFHERCEVEDQIASTSLLLLSFYFSRFHKITKPKCFFFFFKHLIRFCQLARLSPKPCLELRSCSMCRKQHVRNVACMTHRLPFE